MAEPSRLKRMFNFLAALAVVYLALVVLVLLFEKHFIFFPNFPGRLTGDWQPAGLPVEDVWLRTSDGVKLHAWWIAAPQAEFTLVAFHGNAANLANRADIYHFFHELPVNVLAVEYRGYGKSEGAPDEAGLYRDAEAAYAWLVNERHVAPKRIIAYGASLGSAVAADLAARHEVGGVVLEAPFPSAADVARRVYWFVPGLGWFVRTKLDTANKLQAVHAPVLIVHCTRDPVIAFSLGEEVFRRARAPKFFLPVEGDYHEGATLVAPAPIRDKLREFLGTL